MRSVARTLLGRFTSRLRFPQLFAVAAILFVVDLLVPDLIPFVDELLLGLLTALLGSLKDDRDPPPEPEGRRRGGDGEEDRPVKDVTPRD